MMCPKHIGELGARWWFPLACTRAVSAIALLIALSAWQSAIVYGRTTVDSGMEVL